MPWVSNREMAEWIEEVEEINANLLRIDANFKVVEAQRDDALALVEELTAELDRTVAAAERREAEYHASR